MNARIKQICELDLETADLDENSLGLDILDDVCQAIMSKENASHFPETYGKVSLSGPEIAITQVWNAWGLALNGGATEAVSCSHIDKLENALFEVGAGDMAIAVRKLFATLEAFHEKSKNYSEEKKAAEFFDLKDGELRGVNAIFYEPWDRVPRLMLQYIQHNADQISIDGFQ